MARLSARRLAISIFISSINSIAGIALLLSLEMLSAPVLAQTCTANCGSREIQFTPGQRIRLQMVNRTANRIQVEQVYATEPISLQPGEVVEVDSNFGTAPNVSVVFWDQTSASVQAILFRPTPNTLRIELLPTSRSPGDRSVYVENDGRVAIF